MSPTAETLTLLLSLGGVLATAVWTVASIKSAVRQLTREVSHIAKALDRLASSSEAHDRQIANHETRITVMEKTYRNGLGS